MPDPVWKIALAEEHVVVTKQLKATDAVRVHTVVHAEDALITTPVTSEEIEVTRVPLDRWVEAPVAERQEGDTTILTLHAEVPVTETRLKAIEEIRITRRRRSHDTTEKVVLRREEAVLERLPAPATGVGEQSRAAVAPPALESTSPTSKHGA
jgi:stress response protein YsnF